LNGLEQHCLYIRPRMAAKHIFHLFQRQFLWIWLGVFTLFVRFLLSLSPETTETLYARGLFQGVRWLFDYTFGLLPFHSFWVAIPLLLIVISRSIFRLWRRRKTSSGISWKQRLLKSGRRLLSFAGGVTFFFFFLWGFNYQRLPVEEYLQLDITQPDSLELADAFAEAGLLAAGARLQIPNITDDTLSDQLAPPDLEEKVAQTLAQTLQRLGYPASGRTRARMVRPGGWMLSLNVAGIYNPFTGEGNVSSALTPPQVPFTMAHEMSHGYGFGDEGTCNFLALLACTASPDPYIRYSGRFAWWSYLSRELRKVAPYSRGEITKKLHSSVKKDLIARINNSRRYAGRASRIGNKVNDQYLKLQGIKEGVLSYNRIVLMVLAWNKR